MISHRPHERGFCFVHLVTVIFFLLLLVSSSTHLKAQSTSLTIHAGQRRIIGGVSTLDRAQFFTHASTLFPPSSSNLGNLRFEVYSESGLNLTPGRVASEFDQSIAPGLPEDPSRPGFIDPTALRNKLQGDYRTFVTTNTRWESLRNSTSNPIFVSSGRSSDFFDAKFLTGEQSDLFPNREFYADFLTTYLREVVYGPDAFMPVDADRFHIEIINEPDLHVPGIFGGPGAAATLLASSQELARYHRDIAQSIKTEFASASIGGPSMAVTDFSSNDYLRWNNTVKPYQDVTGSFGNLILNGKEGAVVTFTLSGDPGLTLDTFENTFYSDKVGVSLNDGQPGHSPEILIDADTLNASMAKLRVGYSRSVGLEQFAMTINGHLIMVSGTMLGIDDLEFGLIDDGLISREIDIPLEFLTNGLNRIRLKFSGGGFISSTALVVTTSVPEPGSTSLVILLIAVGALRRPVRRGRV